MNILKMYNNDLQKYIDKQNEKLDEYIDLDIDRAVVKRLYLESLPQNLSEWFWFIVTFNFCSGTDIIGILQQHGNLSREKSRKIYRIIWNWLITGHIPSGKARYTLL